MNDIDTAMTDSRTPPPTPYDIFLCCGPKDYNKLPFVLEALHRNLHGFETIVLTTPTRPTGLEAFPELRQVRDPAVLDVDISRWRFRPTWIYQQFLKLFQTVTPNRLYLVVDSDVIVNRPLSLFEEGKPVLFLGRDQYREQYFNFMEKALGLGRVYDHSFITDTMFVDRAIVEDMLRRLGTTREEFVEKSFGLIDEECFISEQELYGNYVMRYYPERYVVRPLRTTFIGKEQHDPAREAWRTEELADAVTRHRDDDYDIVSLHSWIVSRDHKTLRGKIARNARKLGRKLRFGG